MDLWGFYETCVAPFDRDETLASLCMCFGADSCNVEEFALLLLLKLGDWREAFTEHLDQQMCDQQLVLMLLMVRPHLNHAVDTYFVLMCACRQWQLLSAAAFDEFCIRLSRVSCAHGTAF